MEWIAKFIMSFYSIGILFLIITIVYLILRRIKIKEKENFEKRKN